MDNSQRIRNRERSRQWRAEHPDYYKTPYWHAKQREAQRRHLERVGRDVQNRRSLDWYYRNREAQRKYSQHWMRDFLIRWRNGLVADKERQIESEIHAAQEILPKYGFRDAFLTRPYNAYMPFDIIATDKDGAECAVDVTLSPFAKLKTRRGKDQTPLIRRMKLKFFFLHVTPDFRFHSLQELPQDKTSTSCYKKFLLVQEGVQR